MKKFLLIISIISLAIGCGHSVTGSNLIAKPKSVWVNFRVIGGTDFGFQSSVKITVYKEMYKYKDPSECEADIYELEATGKDGFYEYGPQYKSYYCDKIIIEFFPSQAHRATLVNHNGGFNEIDFDNNIATIYTDARKDRNVYYDIRFEIAGDYAKEPMLIGDTYQITTAEELRWIATKVQNGREDFSGKTIKLMNDIDMENKEFSGIGTSSPFVSKEFAGVFDGNGFEIQNLNIPISRGFIGSLGESGVLKNISFTGDIKRTLLHENRGLVSNIYNKANIRELIYDNYGVVQNVYNLGTSTGAGSGYNSALVSYNYGTIKNFYNIGTTTGSSMIFENGKNGKVENIYYIKDAGINEELEGVENNSDPANIINVLPKTVAEFNSGTGITFDDPEGVWQFKSGLTSVNGVTSRYVLKGIGEGR